MKTFYKYLILLCIFMLTGAASGWSAVGTVEAIGGGESVMVKRAGKDLKLKKGDSLEIGDEVVTDKLTAADIRLQDKSIIRLGVNSTYKIQEDSKSKKLMHRLLNGIVRVLVPPSTDNKGEVKFRMNTPEGTIGVRGTEFVVIRDNEETQLKGLTGEVLFGPVDADFDHIAKFVLVTKGYQSSTRAKGVPSKPEKFPLPTYLKQLDNKMNGQFAPLAARTSGSLKMRSGSTATGAAISEPAPLFVKAAERAAEEKKAEIKKPEKPKADANKDLMIAAGMAGVTEVQMALKLGGDVKYRHDGGDTPLHAAAVSDNKEAVRVIELLMEKGADVNAKNNNGQTPLMMLAIESGDPVAALLLIQHGTTLSIKDKFGRNARDIAKEKLKEKNTESYQQLVELFDEHMKDMPQ